MSGGPESASVCRVDGQAQLRPDIPPRLAALLQGFQATPVDVPALLVAMQAEFGFLPERLLKLAVRELQFSLSLVYKAVLSNRELRMEPVAGKHIRICLGPNCSGEESPEILCRIENRLGLASEDSTPASPVVLQTVFCCGACRDAPVIGVGDQLLGKLTPDTAEQAVQAYLARPSKS